jgi:hypothetical protein
MRASASSSASTRGSDVYATASKRMTTVSKPKELWPYALERVGRFPALVHRFVRRGNLPALGEHLLAAGPARRKRGRRPICGTER